jgi:hypothetical protein
MNPLPILYELSTISLNHEAYLYVLRRKNGLANMALLQSVVIRGLRNVVHEIVVVELPASLRKLYLGWEGNTAFYNMTSNSHFNDEQMREFLEWTSRQYLGPKRGEVIDKGPEPPDISGYCNWQRSVLQDMSILIP